MTIWNLENIALRVGKGQAKTPHNTGFHLYDMLRTGKSREIERLLFLKAYEMTEWRVTGKFWWCENVQKITVALFVQTYEYTKNKTKQKPIHFKGKNFIIRGHI